ncbi:MAG: hypothetical protein QNL65_02635 [Opitutales bacterium]
MTKISFDIDFSQDPEQILKEIQERAKAEVEKRESKERNSAYLSNLYKTVNEKISTDFKSVSDLIRALTPYAAPALRDKLAATSASGRRKTISMSMDVYVEIKRLLTEPNPNKAAIARQTGASVVQVRKVADGGFDSKYGNSTSGKSSEKPESPSLPKFSTPSPFEENNKVELKEEEIIPPSLASVEESESTSEEFPSSFGDPDHDSDGKNKTTPSLPSFGEGEETSLPPPAPLDLTSLPAPLSEESRSTEESDDLLHPIPKFTPAPFDSTVEGSEQEDASLPPSFGDEGEPSLLPPATLPEESDDLIPPLPKFTPAPFNSTEEGTENDKQEDSYPLPSFGDEGEPSLPPPAPLGMPPAPAPLAEELERIAEQEDSPPLPSFGDNKPSLPPPAPIVEEPQDSVESNEPEDAPSFPPSPPSPPPMSAKPLSSGSGFTRPPSGLKTTLKPTLGSGKKGKPILSLKPKTKTSGLKITRPPMGGPPPPPPQ